MAVHTRRILSCMFSDVVGISISLRLLLSILQNNQSIDTVLDNDNQDVFSYKTVARKVSI